MSFPLLVGLVGWSQAARAEVMDKVNLEPLWLCTAVLLGFAFALASLRPVLALVVYPLSLFAAYFTLDEVLWGDIGSAVHSEANWAFLSTAYLSVVINLVGPAAANVWARRRRRQPPHP